MTRPATTLPRWRQRSTRAALLCSTAMLILLPEVGLAHDCSALWDCEQTAGYNMVLSLLGAVIAVMASVFGANLAGAGAGAMAASVPGQGDGGEATDDGEGWQVTDAEGNVHLFATREEADAFHQELLRAHEAGMTADRLRQLEMDHRNAADEVEYLRSYVEGLRNIGQRSPEHERELQEWIARRDQLRGELGRAGGDTGYRPLQRTPRIFETQAARAERLWQDDLDARLNTLHRMENALQNLRDLGLVGENPNLTNRIADRLERMSSDLVNGDGPPPSWEEIKRLRGLLGQDMDATRTRERANESDWLREGAADTAREVFTGVNADGETSYKSMVLRGLIAALGGKVGVPNASEYLYKVIQRGYGIHDDVMAGKSFTEAYRNAISRTVWCHARGKYYGWLARSYGQLGRDVGGELGRRLYDWKIAGIPEREIWLDDAVDAVQRGLRKANDVLHTDVRKLLRGKPDRPVVSPRGHPDAPGDAKLPRIRETDRPPLRSKQQRRADFEAGRAAGERKVQQLEEALRRRHANPGSPEARLKVQEAVDAIQADKHAMHQLKSRLDATGHSDTIRAFNEDLQTSYETALETTRKRIAAEYGVPVEDVKVVRATNKPLGSGSGNPADPRGFARRPPSSVQTNPEDFPQRPPATRIKASDSKVPMDHDVSIRVRQHGIDASGKRIPRTNVDPRTGAVRTGHVDVPQADVERVYNQEFYKARHGGKLPYRTNPATGAQEIDMAEVRRFAHKMDQASTDRLSAEAYGSGPAELETAVVGGYRTRPFDDVEGVGRTLEYKYHEWRNMSENMEIKAHELLRAGNKAEAGNLFSQAEALKEEGLRQLGKQYDNLSAGRTEALNNQAGRTVAQIPPRMTEAAEIIKAGGPPVEVEAKLASIGCTPETFAQQQSAYLNLLQNSPVPPSFDYLGSAERFIEAAAQHGRPPG